MRSALFSTTRHADLAVVEQQRVTRLDSLEDLRMRQEHAIGRASALGGVEAERGAFAQGSAAAADLAEAKLRPLQVGEDADGAAEGRLAVAHGGVQLLHHVERRVAHVDAENVDAGLEELCDHLGGVRRRT